MNRTRWNASLDGVCYVALTILVWGVNALQRGMWQDDVQALGEAFQRAGSLRMLFSPFASPLRRLTVLPSALALLMPHPIWALQFLCAAVWLAHGLLAGWIIGLLLPGRRWTRFAVICLTLTASSDYTTGSMVTLAYNVAAMLLLAAVGCALLWLDDGAIVSLCASAVLLACSLLTMEVALPAVPFLILLFAWRELWRPTRRGIVLLAAWGMVLVPAAIVEWLFLHDPTSYAATAVVPISTHVFISRTAKLWLDNFAPWRWAFARPQWYLRPQAVIPAAWMAAGSLFAAVILLLRARGKDDDVRSDDGLHTVSMAAMFAAMALASNAAYALVQLSEFHYRTHILSRVWASAAIGIIAGWLGRCGARFRWVSVAIVTAFVFFGTWGGIERQDFFLANWRHHQQELASILDAAPSLRPGTAVILRGEPPNGRYLATEASYLAKYWLRLLYGEPRLRVMRLDSRQGSGCRPGTAGLECCDEGEAACVAAGACAPKRFRYEELVVMDYDPRSWTWHLVRSFRDDPFVRGYAGDAARYRPENRIVERPWTVRQKRLLLVQRFEWR